ncbi:MAG: aminodeoxychorismate synthase component I [Candidatus Aureabacteria bacterium]|nr:aminodeoxychorismate synthase component I [Candidatus Auribacterota bacterium]
MTSTRAFIFLDTVASGPQQKHSYVFSDPVLELTAEKYEELNPLLDQIQDHAKKYWLCGYLAYEAAYVLEEKLMPFTSPHPPNPLAWFGIFESPCVFDHQKKQWNHPPSFPDAGKVLPISPQLPEIRSQLSEKNYVKTIQEIKKKIKMGDIYQINFTYDYSIRSGLDDWTMYQIFRERQKAPFSAFIRNKYLTLLSFSPEMFFTIKNRIIWTQPMKGTEKRGRYEQEDKKLFHGLSMDKKNQSENVMIVDLLRNDLGKICETGSIKVSKLFEVTSYPTLHQMTSTISGRLPPCTTFKKIIQNIFPSGSVTGAPKIRSMEWIHSFEKGRREVYCGAIGFISPRMKKAVFSVPIRILQKHNHDKAWQYRVGSGIVWDSDPVSEWNECLTKCSFLTEPAPLFMIMESILWNGKSLVYLQEHSRRLKNSARFLGYPCLENKWKQAIQSILNRLKGTNRKKVRIFLDKEGKFRWDFSPLNDLKKAKIHEILLSKVPVDENNRFLFHKTTFRPWYEQAMKNIKNGKCFDVIFMNSKGQITEGSITNIFIQKGDGLFTPDVTCGLLPGILRQRLLKKKKCREAVIHEHDLFSADAIFCGNSVRGLVRVKLKE